MLWNHILSKIDNLINSEFHVCTYPVGCFHNKYWQINIRLALQKVSLLEKLLFGIFHLSSHFGVTQYWKPLHQNMLNYSASRESKKDLFHQERKIMPGYYWFFLDLFRMVFAPLLVHSLVVLVLLLHLMTEWKKKWLILCACPSQKKFTLFLSDPLSLYIKRILFGQNRWSYPDQTIGQ